MSKKRQITPAGYVTDTLTYSVATVAPGKGVRVPVVNQLGVFISMIRAADVNKIYLPVHNEPVTIFEC